MADPRVTRRELLAAAAAAGVACAWPWDEAEAQGFLANLAPEEPVEATLKRLFAGRPVRDGSAVMTFEAPLLAEDGGNVPGAIEIKSPLTPQSHVKAIYILSDKNPRPPNAKGNPTPAGGPAHHRAHNRPAGTGDDV